MNTGSERSPEQLSTSDDGNGIRRAGRLSTIIEIAAVVLFIAAATTFAIITPRGGAPDEDGHVVYATAVSHGHLPTPAPATRISTDPRGEVTYDCAQAHHPPLYYAVVGGIWALTGRVPGLLTPIGRGVSIIAGVVALLLLRAAMHITFPERRVAVAAGLAILVASPTFTYIMGSFNNETFAVLAVCASLYLAARALKSPSPLPWMLALGAAVGLGMLAKLTAFVSVLPLLLAGIAVARKSGRRWRGGRGLAAGLAVAVIMVAPWLLRNYFTVGAVTFNCADRPPLFGSMAEVIWQPGASLLAAALGMEEMIAGAWWLEWLLREHHTWLADVLIGGAVNPETRPLWMFLLPIALGILGLTGTTRLLGRGDEGGGDQARRCVVWMLIFIPVVGALGILHQALLVDGHILRWAGRYTPALLPSVSMVVGPGLTVLLPARWEKVLPVVGIAGAVLLNVLAVLSVITLYS